ncbi:MAG: ABC-2 family transporter protein [Chloroflexi bacterium]|nr:ABC-2 family transporter protein [Chloroflexota bacterium]
MLRIYQRFWMINWAEQWQYRANLLMYLAYWVVFPIVYLTVWSAIANGAPSGMVQGMNARDFAAYYLTLLAVDLATTSVSIHMLASKIQDGTISNELLRPVHPILTNTFVNDLAFKALQMLIFVPVWLALTWLFNPALTYTWSSFLLALPAIVLGFLMSFLITTTTTLMAFWTTRVHALHDLVFAVAKLFSGQFVPLLMLPLWMQGIARVLPFQLSMSFPTLILLNKMTPGDIALNYVLQIVWIVALFILFRMIWTRALRRFSAVGA